MPALSSLSPVELKARLRSSTGLRLSTGPFVFRIRSAVPAVADGISLHYAAHPMVEPHEPAFCDFHVEVRRPSGIRAVVRPQVEFRFDGERPFLPLPGNHGFPMLEWGMNWSISAHAHQYLIIHAAVLERGGRALVMPAPPGSGKSTLCAALAWRGWRLLSDELALLQPTDNTLWPLARPVSLKNQSIDVIRAWEPRARLSEPVHETVKGSVAHMSAPPDAVARVHEPARPGWLVLPKYVPESPAQLEPMTQPRAFMEVQQNTFNYHVHGAAGFDALGRFIRHSSCHTFRYSRLQDAVDAFEQLPPPP